MPSSCRSRVGPDSLSWARLEGTAAKGWNLNDTFEASYLALTVVAEPFCFSFTMTSFAGSVALALRP
jgi:hypothetical protein